MQSLVVFVFFLRRLSGCLLCGGLFFQSKIGGFAVVDKGLRFDGKG